MIKLSFLEILDIQVVTESRSQRSSIEGKREEPRGGSSWISVLDLEPEKSEKESGMKGAGAGERGWLDAAFSSRRQIGKGRGLKIDTFICIGPMSAVFQVLTGVSNDCFTLQAKLFFVEKKTLKFSDAKISWKQEWEKFSLS